MSTIIASSEILRVVEELQQLKKFKKDIEKQEKRLVQKLYNYMNEYDELCTEDGESLLTWKYSDGSKYFDAKKFQEDNNELYLKYIALREGSRRLLLK